MGGVIFIGTPPHTYTHTHTYTFINMYTRALHCCRSTTPATYPRPRFPRRPAGSRRPWAWLLGWGGVIVCALAWVIIQCHLVDCWPLHATKIRPLPFTPPLHPQKRSWQSPPNIQRTDDGPGEVDARVGAFLGGDAVLERALVEHVGGEGGERGVHPVLHLVVVLRGRLEVRVGGVGGVVRLSFVPSCAHSIRPRPSQTAGPSVRSRPSVPGGGGGGGRA